MERPGAASERHACQTVWPDLYCNDRLQLLASLCLQGRGRLKADQIAPTLNRQKRLPAHTACASLQLPAALGLSSAPLFCRAWLRCKSTYSMFKHQHVQASSCQQLDVQLSWRPRPAGPGQGAQARAAGAATAGAAAGAGPPGRPAGTAQAAGREASAAWAGRPPGGAHLVPCNNLSWGQLCCHNGHSPKRVHL